MKSNKDAADELGRDAGEGESCPESPIPTLEIRVFGGFDALLGGEPIDSRYSRQRRIQTLLTILALNHGQELYSDYLADSIWPRSVEKKKRHCFDNLWYLATHAIYDGKRESNPYFERRVGTCRMLDAHVRTDVERIDSACIDLMRRDLDPVRALEAYRRLQRAYRGDLLPGETENAIIIRARHDWNERVTGALSAAAQTMRDCGEDRTALWFATVASRLSGMREDVVRLRMDLLSRMGMQAYAVRAYHELEDYLQQSVGMQPSPQSIAMMRQVVDASDLGLVLSEGTSSRRRRREQAMPASRQQKAEFAFGDALPLQSEHIARPM